MSRKVDFGMALILTVVVEGCWTDAEKKGKLNGYVLKYVQCPNSKQFLQNVNVIKFEKYCSDLLHCRFFFEGKCSLEK